MAICSECGKNKTNRQDGICKPCSRIQATADEINKEALNLPPDLDIKWEHNHNRLMRDYGILH